MTKKPAVLLEILIALTLIVLLLVPLIRQPIKLHEASKERIERIEAGRIAAWTFTEIREKLIKNEFRWEQLPPFKTESKIYELPSVALQLPPVCDKVIDRTYTLRTIEEKEHEGKITRLLSVFLKVGDFKGTYRLIVEKPENRLTPATQSTRKVATEGGKDA